MTEHLLAEAIATAVEHGHLVAEYGETYLESLNDTDPTGIGGGGEK